MYMELRKNSPCIPKNGIITINGTNKILIIVNLFGKFILQNPFSVLYFNSSIAAFNCVS